MEPEFVTIVGPNGIEHRFPKLTDEERESVITTLVRVLARQLLEEWREGRLGEGHE